MKIGEFIRSKRKEKKLTLKQLAEKIGLSHTYLSQIELGDRNVSPDMLDKISKALDVPYIDLMTKAGYLYEQTPFEQDASEFSNLAQLIISTINSLISAKQHIKNFKNEQDLDEEEKLNKKFLIERIEIDKINLQGFLTHLDSLENKIKSKLEYENDKIQNLIEKLNSF